MLNMDGRINQGDNGAIKPLRKGKGKIMADQNETVTPQERDRLELQRKADETNKSRSGVGTRVSTGLTRGKGSVAISWEEFDENLPETLPADMAQFMSVTGVKDEKTILSYLITGYNDSQYKQASDPVAEHVNPAWSDERKNQFRLTVRNYAKATESSIEDAVAVIKPGVEKKFAAEQEAAKK